MTYQDLVQKEKFHLTGNILRTKIMLSGFSVILGNGVMIVLLEDLISIMLNSVYIHVFMPIIRLRRP